MTAYSAKGDTALRSLFFLALAAFLTIAYLFAASPQERLAARLLSEDQTSDAWAPIADSAFRLVAKGTRYDGHWQINQAPRAGYLNLYLITVAYRGRSPRYLSALTENCAYIGAPGIIVCDTAFLARFRAQEMTRAAYRDSAYTARFTAQEISARYRADLIQLLAWVLGHEVGHILLKHRPAHFAASRLDAYVMTSALDQRQELQADSFYVSRIVADSATSIAAAAMLTELVNRQIEKKVGVVTVAGVGIHYDYTGQDVVTFSPTGTHPEYVIRAARALELLGRQNRPYLSVGPMIESFIRSMKETR